MPGDFFDSNVVLYAFSTDAAKAGVSEALIRRGGTISVQVLNEVANVARRKMKLGWKETRTLTDTLRALFEVKELTLETHERGLELAERFGLSVFDGLIVAAAQLADCTRVYSEDMQDGLKIDALHIKNPFTSARRGGR